MSGTILGHQWVAVHYLDVTGTAITVDDLQTLADEIASMWSTHPGSQVTSDCTLQQVDVRYIPSTGTELRYTGTYSYAGTGSGTTIDNASACAVISWVISDYYRGGHPRTYQPGIAAAYCSNGSDLDSSWLTNLVGEWNNYRNAMNAFTTTNITALVMGTVRFESGGAWLSPPVFTAFTSVKAGKKLKLGSQRRRILS